MYTPPPNVTQLDRTGSGAAANIQGCRAVACAQETLCPHPRAEKWTRGGPDPVLRVSGNRP